MTDDDIKTARELCADPPEQDSIDPPTCPACGDEYILDNDNGTHGHMMCDPCGAEAFDKARTLVPALLDALEAARRDLAIAHHDASQLSGNANRVLRELKERMFAKIERYERDAEAAQVDLAATKAALVEAIQLIEAIDDTDGLGMLWMIKGLEALKAKVQP